MKARLLSGFAVLSALLGILFSCSANGGSIYATIEAEKKTAVSLLPQNITIIDLVKTGGPLPYFVAAGAVYNGSLPDAVDVVGWPVQNQAPIAIVPPASGALCEALVAFGAVPPLPLFGGFYTSNGSIMGLYKSATSPYSFQGASAIGSPGPFTGKQITFLQTTSGAPPYLFAVAATASPAGYTYELYYSTDGSIFLLATGMTGLAKPITGVAYFNNNYFVTCGGTLYVTTTPNDINTLSSIGSIDFNTVAGSTDDLRGVTADGTYILIPAKSGNVYYSTDGISTWGSVPTNDQVNQAVVGFLNVSAQVGLKPALTLPVTPNPVYTYLVGSDGLGYYYLTLTLGGTPTLTRYSDVTVTGLYAGSVRRILVDLPNGNTVLMGNNATGLWRATFNSTTGAVSSSWVHE